MLFSSSKPINTDPATKLQLLLAKFVIAVMMVPMFRSLGGKILLMQVLGKRLHDVLNNLHFLLYKIKENKQPKYAFVIFYVLYTKYVYICNDSGLYRID